MSRSSAKTHSSRRLHLQRIVDSLTGPKRDQDGARCRGLVGVDVADGRLRPRQTLFIPLLIACLIGALFLVGLRNDLTAMRYATAEALAEEEQLRAEKRALTVEMRQLRDPSRLTERARELGFVHPERIVDLPAAPGDTQHATEASQLPATRIAELSAEKRP